MPDTYLTLIDARELLDTTLRDWKQGASYSEIHTRIKDLRRLLKRAQRVAKYNREEE